MKENLDIEIDYHTFPGIGHHLDVTAEEREIYSHGTFEPGATPEQIAQFYEGIYRSLEEESLPDTKIFRQHLVKLIQHFRPKITGK